MSVEIISLGHFDYSDFHLTSFEEAIVTYLIKYHIYSYEITIDTYSQELVFYTNMTDFSQDKATDIFITVFNLLEKQFIKNQLNSFIISILHHDFIFSRILKEDITSDSVSHLVNWKISINDLSKLKLDLFDFYHKKQDFNSLLQKYPPKNNIQKTHKI